MAQPVTKDRPCPTLADLAAWYEQPLGTRLWQAELRTLSTLLADRYLPNSLIVGGPVDTAELCNSTYRVTLGPRPPVHGDLWASPEELPLLSRSFDLVVLVHVLEYSAYPGAMLSEVRRVLAPEGLLALVAFNPHSFWAWGERLKRRGNGLPGHGRSWSASVLRKGVREAGLTPLAFRRVCLPTDGTTSPHRLQELMPPCALSHAALARRRDVGATPLAVRPRFSRTLVGDRFPQPTSRSMP
jgi:SAM-dependent methyltransferase